MISICNSLRSQELQKQTSLLFCLRLSWLLIGLMFYEGCSPATPHNNTDNHTELVKEETSHKETQSNNDSLIQNDEAQNGERWAVIIGINSYPGDDPRLPPLKFAVNDARAMHDLLIAEFGYKANHVLFLNDKGATRELTRRAFSEWLPARNLGRNDSILVFFAGHGLIEGYLGAVDSSTSDLRQCISVSWLVDRLADLDCQNKLLILDSCYSGQLFMKQQKNKKPGSTHIHDGASNKPVFWGISAGRITPVTDGEGDGHHSIFTASLLRVMRERANSRRSNGSFTFQELASRVESLVAAHPQSYQVPDWGRLTSGKGSFVFTPELTREPPRKQSRLLEQHHGVHEYANSIKKTKSKIKSGDYVSANQILQQLQDNHETRSHCNIEWGILALVCKQRSSLNAQELSASIEVSKRLGTRLNTPDRPTRILKSLRGKRFQFGFDNDVIFAFHERITIAHDAESGKPIPLLSHTICDISTDGQHYVCHEPGKLVVRQSKFLETNSKKLTTNPKKINQRELIDALASMAKRGLKLENSNGREKNVRFTANSRLIFGQYDKGIVFWNATDGSLHRRIPIDKPKQRLMSVSPGGRWIKLPNGQNNTIYAVDSHDSKQPLKLGRGAVTFSNDDRLAALATRNNKIHLYDIKKKKQLVSINGRVSAFSSDSKKLAVVNSKSDSIILYNVETGEKVGLLQRKNGGHWIGRVQSLTFSPDSKRIVSCGSQLVIWDIESQAEIFNYENPSGIYDFKMAVFSRNGDKLAVSNGNIHVLNIPNKPPFPAIVSPRQQNGGILSVVFSSDGEWLATGAMDGTLILWNGKKLSAKTQISLGPKDAVASVAFDHGSKRLALISTDIKKMLSRNVSEKEDVTLSIWELSKNGILKRLNSIVKPLGRNEKLGSTQTISSVSFSPDNKLIAFGLPKRTIILNSSDYSDQKKIKVLGAPSVFSRDGNLLLGLGYGSGLVYSTDNWTKPKSILKDKIKIQQIYQAMAIASSPDCKHAIVIGSQLSMIGARIYSIETGHPVAKLEEPKSAISVSYTPDGKRIITGDADGTINIWDADTGIRLMSLVGSSTDPITSIAISPDSNTIVIGNLKGDINYWTTLQSKATKRRRVNTSDTF